MNKSAETLTGVQDIEPSLVDCVTVSVDEQEHDIVSQVSSLSSQTLN